MADPLYDLARDLRVASAEAADEARAVVKKGAVNVKRDWRANAKAYAPTHAKYYPSSITFDISDRGVNPITAVVGPDKDKKQGALGVLLEFGTPTSPPHNDGGRALRAEEDRFVEALGDVAEDVL